MRWGTTPALSHLIISLRVMNRTKVHAFAMSALNLFGPGRKSQAS